MTQAAKKKKKLIKFFFPTPALTATAEETPESERRLTFAVGVIVPQRAETIPAHAAASRLQVHAVGVLHAAVALRAEVMTCGRRRDEKVALSGGRGRRGSHIINVSALIYL